MSKLKPFGPRPWHGVYDELGVEMPEMDDRPFAVHIARHADAKPDAPALVLGERILSYGEYDQEASKLANALEGLGVGPGDVAGIHMPNIPQYPIAVTAISRMGAVGSGVSPLLAPPEIAYQIADANITVLLTLADLAPALSAADLPDHLHTVVVCGAGDYMGAPAPDLPEIAGVKVVAYADMLKGVSPVRAQAKVDPHDTFFIQYTGGTTGRPKGAQLSHRTVVNNGRMVSAFNPSEAGEREVYASGFPMFHIAGLSLAITAGIDGALYILVPNPRDTAGFIAAMHTHPPTKLANVPALYDMMLADPDFARIDFSALQFARMGAAPMTATTRNALEAVIGPGKLSDVFGMTETGPCYLVHPASRYKPGALGIPMPGADVKIMDVDNRDREMPIGEVGEIVTHGAHVMRGYLNLQDESAHALREVEGRRYMYSGDVGYMDDEGYVFLCDRAKDMLIVGGFKVFSVEVEDKLKSLPCVAESAIIGTPDTARPGNDIVNLFVQLAPDHRERDGDAVREEITGFVRANMAPYKVPRHIHIIPEIPLTPVGKIDKKALRKTALHEIA